MSEYLRISSLLNNGAYAEEPQIPEALPDEAARDSAQATVRPRDGGGGYTDSSLPLNRYSTHLEPLSQRTQQGQQIPARVPDSRTVNDSLHVTRSQPIYTVFDYRYLPYLPHALPAAHDREIPSNPTAPPVHDAPNSIGALGTPYGTSAISQDHNRNQQYGHMGYLAADFMVSNRKRRTRACQNCHLKKIKCHGDGRNCFNCTQANIECKWIPMKKRGPKPKEKPIVLGKHGTNFATPFCPLSGRPDLHNGIKANTNSSLANVLNYGPKQPEITDDIMRQFYSKKVDEETREAVIYFFDYFYATYPAFHPATFIRRVVNGQVDQLLIDSMRASVARIITKNTGKYIDVDKSILEIQKKLILQLDNPTMDFVLSVILLASICGGESKFVSYNSLTCLSSSLVARLGWHTVDLLTDNDTEMPWDDWVTLELKRRIFWVVYENDSYQSLLGDRPMTVSENRLFASAPGSDHTWEDVSVHQAKSWPTRSNLNMSKEEILKTGSLLHTFIDCCNFTTLVSRLNNFLWDVKISIASNTSVDRFAPNLKYLKLPPLKLSRTKTPIKSLFEYEEFGEIHRLITEWKRDLIKPYEVTGGWETGIHFSQFGTLKHRLFMMRIRYFCLYTYSVPALLYLHFSNRPSYFAKNTKTQKEKTDTNVSDMGDDSIEDSAIKQLLATAFAERLNDGLLAYDIVEESWKICLENVYDLILFLDKNNDIPLDRCTQVVPFCLFTSITVLIRQIKKCRQKIEQIRAQGVGDLNDIQGDLSKSVGALRCLWTRLKDLGFIWRVDGMEHLLLTMNIEEMANTADLFSSLAL